MTKTLSNIGEMPGLKLLSGSFSPSPSLSRWVQSPLLGPLKSQSSIAPATPGLGFELARPAREGLPDLDRAAAPRRRPERRHPDGRRQSPRQPIQLRQDVTEVLPRFPRSRQRGWRPSSALRRLALNGSPASWAVVLVLSLLSGRAQAGDEVFDARGFNYNRDFFSQLPYEHIDPLTGNLLLTFTDLALPGNAGFELRIQRNYKSKILKAYQPSGDPLDEDSWAGIGWTLHLGRVLNALAIVPGPIEMPDGSRHKLFNHIDGSGRFITREFWIYDRSVNVLLLPNGTRYTLGQAASLSIGGVATSVRYPTQIPDPFGNFFTISYITTPADGIHTIIQDLGGGETRTVTFTTDGTLQSLQTITHTGAQTHTWTYTQTNTLALGFSLLSS